MAKKPYPLTALSAVRKDATTRATEALAKERAREAEAARLHHEAVTARNAHSEATNSEVHHEGERLMEGELSARDLAALETFRVRRALEDEALLAKATEKERDLRDADARVTTATTSLLARATEEKVVEKHREKFVANEKRAALQKEELESEDLRK